MKKVTSIKDLRRLATLRRSVIWERSPGVHWPAPAAWVLRMQADQVDWIIFGGLYEYEPKHKKGGVK